MGNIYWPNMRCMYKHLYSHKFYVYVFPNIFPYGHVLQTFIFMCFHIQTYIFILHTFINTDIHTRLRLSKYVHVYTPKHTHPPHPTRIPISQRVTFTPIHNGTPKPATIPMALQKTQNETARPPERNEDHSRANNSLQTLTEVRGTRPTCFLLKYLLSIEQRGREGRR